VIDGSVTIDRRRASIRTCSLTIANPYFEEIEWEALDVLVTERGPTRPRDLRSGDIPVARTLRAARAQ